MLKILLAAALSCAAFLLSAPFATARDAAPRACSGACALEVGEASFYGGRHHGRAMANGQSFNQWSDSCAHKQHPFGTRLRVTHMVTRRSVDCVVRDRGPFVRGRVVDLSVRGAGDLGIRIEGVAPVTVEVVR